MSIEKSDRDKNLTESIEIPNLNRKSLNFKRNFSGWGGSNGFYSSLENFNESIIDQKSTFSIYINGNTIDGYIGPIFEGKPLVVFFNGAISKEARIKSEFPIFSGTRLHEYIDIDCNILCLSDPALHLSKDIIMAWYVGYKEINLTPIITNIIQKIHEQTKSNTIIFVGGSSGGFAALNISKNFPNSIAFLLNPQVNIEKYYSYHTNLFARTCFDVDKFSKIYKEIKDEFRMNLIDLYSNGFENLIVYFQNSTDDHLSRHAVPFLKCIGIRDPEGREGRFNIIDKKVIYCVGSWGKGHAAPPRAVTYRVIEAIAQKNKNENWLEGDVANKILTISQNQSV